MSEEITKEDVLRQLEMTVEQLVETRIELCDALAKVEWLKQEQVSILRDLPVEARMIRQAVKERDEARAEVQRLQGIVADLFLAIDSEKWRWPEELLLKEKWLRKMCREKKATKG